jgi:hypothetical protein
MEILENNLVNIQEFHKDALQRQSDLVYKGIKDVSNHSIKSANDFDFKFKLLFPSDIGKDDTFTPSCIVEFREGKAFQIMDNIANPSELLANRTVMGSYYIDNLCNRSIICGNHVNHNISFSNNTYATLSCGCTISSGNTGMVDVSVLKNWPFNVLSSRNEEKEIAFVGNSTCFQVDNYLNLFHKESGLYLLFNKTAFPNLPFYFAKHFSQLRDEKDIYYKIFSSKRVNSISFQLNNATYMSVDARPTFLKQVNELIPDDYPRVFELFNRFRKFDGYGENNGLPPNNSMTDLSNTENLNCLDSKDRIIRELTEKLNIMVLRSEKEAELVQQMMSEYRSKSVEIENLHGELNLARIHIDAEKSKKELKFVSDLEKIKQENFNLLQQLLEAEKYRVMFDSTGTTLDSVRKENETLNLKILKLNNINNGLLDTIKSEKERNKKLVEDNDLAINNINAFKYEESSLKKIITSTKSELKKYQEENIVLVDKLTEIGGSSSNALELALTNRITELEQSFKECKTENKKLLAEIQKLEESKRKIENTLKNIKF